MKVSFFHLMPYQDLPDDFAEQHHSAWVDLPNENFDPAKGNEYYAQYIDQLRYADEVGFRWNLRQRAPQQRLRHHAVAQPHRLGTGPTAPTTAP